MLYKKNELGNMLFKDAETIAQYSNISEVPEAMKEIWLRKYHKKHFDEEILFLKNQKELFGEDYKEPDQNDIYLKYAALYAEFGKVLCISIGIFDEKNKMAKDITSFFDPKESALLTEFAKVVDSLSGFILTGYNILGFDIPFIIKRMIICGVALPKALQLKGKKPWEITVNDIMQDWKSTSWLPITLDLLCVTLGIESPKGEIKNFQVSTYFHAKKLTLSQIVKYCEGDIEATMDVAMSLSK